MSLSQFEISTDPQRLQFERIHKYLSQEAYWSQKIPEPVLKKALLNSMCFGIYKIDTTPSEILVGFGRVITDKSTFAYLCDVFVITEYRNLGLAKKLMTEIVSHPDLQNLRRFCLATKDAHTLYEKYGFRITDFPERWMEIRDPEVYERFYKP